MGGQGADSSANAMMPVTLDAAPVSLDAAVEARPYSVSHISSAGAPGPAETTKPPPSLARITATNATLIAVLIAVFVACKVAEQANAIPEQRYILREVDGNESVSHVLRLRDLA